MTKIKRDDLSFLGDEYQLRLINQIITDRIFADSILDILEPTYFSDEHSRVIMSTIKEAKVRHEAIPDYATLEMRLLESVSSKHEKDYYKTIIKQIKDADLNDTLFIQEMAINFCKYQVMKNTIRKLDKIVETGDISKYDECETILRDALDHGNSKDDGFDVLYDLESVLADDFRKPIRTGINGLDGYMDGGLSKGELAIVLAAYGVGKEQPNSAKIYTPTGYKLMGDIKVNDKILGSDGKIQKVVGVFPQGKKDIYNISFNDNTSTQCGLEHLWAVNSMSQRNRSSHKDGKNIKLPKDESFKILTTKEIKENLIVGTNNKHLNYKIPQVKPVNFTKKELPIHPYVLGALLGDGNMPSSRVTTKDEQLIEELSKLVEITHRERCKEIDNGDVMVLRCIESVTILGIVNKLKVMGLRNTLSHNKFIPKDYMYNSISNRIELLQGLLDTDGYCSKRGGIQYTTVSHQLSIDVRELVLSLGGFCGIRTKIPTYKYLGVKKYGKLSYILTISFPSDLNIVPFKLIRKLERVINRDIYSTNKYIKNIELSHKEEATCIMVSNPDHLYVTDDFILTHNTTFLTKIANTALMDGNKVLQIFFEDNPKVIQRKHLSCFTKIKLNDLSNNKEEVTRKANEMMKGTKNGTGELKLKKFASDGTTMPAIRKYIRKLIAQGFKPDLVVLDYIDVVQASKASSDVYFDEGTTMRQFETMLSELDIAGWTAVQGNRSAITAEVVEGNHMGGSIKKGQIGHFVVSVAKSLDQKDDGTATMAIIKSRFGKDGVIFTNILYDNSNIQIDVSEDAKPKNRREYKQDIEKENNDHIRELFANKIRHDVISDVNIKVIENNTKQQ